MKGLKRCKYTIDLNGIFAKSQVKGILRIRCVDICKFIQKLFLAVLSLLPYIE